MPYTSGMGKTAHMPPIYRIKAYLAARAELCEHCRKAPKQAAFEGCCSEDCLDAEVARQSY
jgi:hypothetical protein